MKSNIKWIILFSLICVICLSVWIIEKNTSSGTAAVIRQGNRIIGTVDLEKIKEPYEFTVTDENGGYNVIRAQKGKIAVIDANCSDKICVRQGYIENGAVPIVCLPHKLTVTIEGAGEEADAVAGR